MALSRMAFSLGTTALTTSRTAPSGRATAVAVAQWP
jgi:hypothetical protein